MDRVNRRIARPAIEALEGRQLLNGSHDAITLGNGAKLQMNDTEIRRLVVQMQARGISPSDVNSHADLVRVANRILPTVEDRRILYTDRDGTRVTVTLYGAGTLQGSTVDPDGALNLVFDGTDRSSRIVAKAIGGNGRAPIASLRDADVELGSSSGAGTNVIDQVNLAPLDLVDRGYINLAAGINRFTLRSAGAFSAIYLREMPKADNTDSAGRDVTYAGSAGSELFVAVDEYQIAPGVTEFFVVQNEPEAEPPPGVKIQIREIRGRERDIAPQPAQIFGYDPATNAILRFSTGTGNVLQSIPLGGGMGPANAGITLGRANGNLVLLASDGTTVRAFNPITGSAIGQFTTATPITGLASTDVQTFGIIAATSPTQPGQAFVIDVAASLQSGTLQTLGTTFTPSRELDLLGGATGVGGSNVIFADAAAHFDSFQPNVKQAGNERIIAPGNNPVELARTQLPTASGGGNIADPFNPPAANQSLGSVELTLARPTFDATNGVNVLTLIDPTTLTPEGRVTLNYASPLADLSESFHPELAAGAAIVDVRGTILFFDTDRARGLVLHDAGTLTFFRAKQLVNSVIVGYPVGHLQIHRRQNVEIFSTARSVDDRNGVTVVPNLRKLAPLSPPVGPRQPT